IGARDPGQSGSQNELEADKRQEAGKDPHGDSARHRMRRRLHAQHALGIVARRAADGPARPQCNPQAIEKPGRLPLPEQHQCRTPPAWQEPFPPHPETRKPIVALPAEPVRIILQHIVPERRSCEVRASLQPLTLLAAETLSFSRNCEIRRLRCFRSHTSRSMTSSVKSGAVRPMVSLWILASLAAITCAILASEPGSLMASTTTRAGKRSLVSSSMSQRTSIQRSGWSSKAIRAGDWIG